MKMRKIQDLEQVPFKGDMIDNCFYVVEPYAPIKAVPMRSVFEAIIERAKKEGLSIEIENDRITFISGATWVLANEKRAGH